MTEEEQFPDHYTFSQRYGYEPLPETMKLGFLSDNLRRELCNTFSSLVEYIADDFVSNYSSRTSERLLQSVLGEFEGIPDRKVNTFIPAYMDKIENILIKFPCHRVLTFLEILLRQMGRFLDADDQSSCVKIFQRLFEKHGTTYRLMVNQENRCWFYPCESEEHAKAVSEAINTLQKGNFEGANTHLQKAAEFINIGDHRNAIAESIDAVESVARKIDPEANKTLTPALKSLQKNGLLNHEALRQAFEKLYGYTSDEEGIRHPLIDKDEANVGLDESLFMFGACAAFAGYLVRKHYFAGNPW